MGSRSFRPWSEVVRLHPDVEAGALTESVFAIDLGALASGDKEVPAVYRDPEAFFRATYITADLRKLLEEVLGSLSAKKGFDRVLKLRTPFGGGKSHTLATLFHAARSRKALGVLPEAKGFADPGQVAIAVFDGEKFDARNGKTLPDGRTIQTMWGWIAYQIDPKKAFPLVEGHDSDRVAPGGDVIREVLTKGAGGRPVLILLDEVLKYMERASAVTVHDSTLQRQAKDFFQNLTVEVTGCPTAAMVYSLTWSAREALGNEALLQEIDKLAARVDQLREPVTGDEVLPILQRRLLGASPDEGVAQEVADAYAGVVSGMRRAFADSEQERRDADHEGLAIRDRINGAYPFHPALIDLMRERWTAVDAFQRTRGALRFLASCLHSLKRNGGARPLLGPGDVPLKDVDVRVKMLKELGAQNDFDPVVIADIDGPNARAKRIDVRLARETPALTNVRPATRLATAIFMYSFGGLRRGVELSGDALPPGVTEGDLLAACVGPDLDHATARFALAELRSSCLYLHYDGVHYVFKKDPNVTMLVEDAEKEVSREEIQGRGQGPVRTHIRELLDRRLAGRDAYVWPASTQDVPDEVPRFLVAYLPLEFAGEKAADQERHAKELFTKCGDRRRQHRNGLGLAIPDKRQVEPLRRAVRYLLAVERVEGKKQQHRLTKDQLDQLRERRRTEEAASEAAFRELYSSVWLPRVEKNEVSIERIEKGGKPLQAMGVHERIMELLMGQAVPKVYGSLTPTKVVQRLKLGEAPQGSAVPVLGIPIREVLASFFCVLNPPRLESEAVIRKAIARGVAEGSLGYLTGPVPGLGPDGKFQVNRTRVALGRTIMEDEVDIESGFVILPTAIPEDSTGTHGPTPAPGGGPIIDIPPSPPTGGGTIGAPGKPAPVQDVRFSFVATRDQVFKAFPAIANLAERSDSGQLTIHVEAHSAKGYEPTWFRNAVEEPLHEADIGFELPPGVKKVGK